MMTANDIREIDFSSSMNGYKKAEVDDFLDELAIDYEKLMAQNQQLNAKLAALMKEKEQSGRTASAEPAPAPKTVQTPQSAAETTENVRGILESAQRFSDQLISEAKQKAEAVITEAALKAKQLEEKIASDKAKHEETMQKLKFEVEAQASGKLKTAAEKSEGIITAARDSVARQQLLFDKLRAEADEFKNKLLDSYKKQLELLNSFPPEVPFDAKRAAEAIEFNVNKKPDFTSFVSEVPAEAQQEFLQDEMPAEDSASNEDVKTEDDGEKQAASTFFKGLQK